jgi:hypothetical protein
LWPLRVASQVGDQSIARRARWICRRALVTEGFPHALAEARVHRDRTP